MRYYVVRNRSIVSKHLFAGSSRLVTRLEMGTAPGNEFQGSGSNPASFNTTTTSGNSNGQGSGKDHGNQGNAYAYGQSKDNPGQGATKGNAGQEHGNGNTQGKANSGSHGNAGENTTNLPGNSEKGLENALANGKGNKYGIYKHLAKEGYTVDEGGNIVVDAGEGGATPITGDTAAPVANGQSEFTYYYHPDYLGSTGYVTDANGKLYEHIEYFPFGETWVQEHSNTLRTPYLFTGKEYDQETGLYYFGARYYDPRTSVWQSADPILDKYLPEAPIDPEDIVRLLPGTIKNPVPHFDLPGVGGVYASQNIAMYAFSGLNPVNFVDPDGNARGPVNKFAEKVIGVMALGFFDAKDAGQKGGDVYDFAVATQQKFVGRASENYRKTQGKNMPRLMKEALGNAVRHAAWQAKITKEHGAVEAAIVGGAHELGESGSRDTQADKHNNAVGRKIGSAAKSDADIEKGILKALNKGELIKNYNDRRLDKSLPVFLPD